MLFLDINDLFREMMNRGRREWTDGRGDNGEGWDDGERRPPNIRLPKVKKIWFALGGLFILFTMILPWFANFMTDLYWFEANGYDAVFWRRIVAQWELFAAALVPGFAVYAVNWRVAWKRGSAFLGGAAEDPQFRKMGKLVFVVAFVVAVVNALTAMGMWDEFLKFRNPVPFGETDPLFGIDIGFYVFTLPFVKFVQAWGQGVLMLALVGSCAVYFMTRVISIQNGRPYAAPAARLHLTLLGALILAFWGAGYWLNRYELLFSPTGVVWGAGYTDASIVLPALSILAFAMFAAAVLLCVNFFKPMWKLSAVIVGVLIVVGWAARTVVPGVVQQYIVKPNAREDLPRLPPRLHAPRLRPQRREVRILLARERSDSAGARGGRGHRAQHTHVGLLAAAAHLPPAPGDTHLL